MSSKQIRKKESAHRGTSGQMQTPSKEIASLVASAVIGTSEPKRGGKFPIWPEWNEADVNSEKWDMGKSGKEKDKSMKSINMYFDDPEGKIEMPASFKVHSWKRPVDCYNSMIPVIMKDETTFDLLSANEHLFSCELMRWLISEIYSVWRIYNWSVLTENSKSNAADPPTLIWKPWEHIYAHCKAFKGHVPQYNSYGKYVVKLYWMGCWRKITVDDTLPFNEENCLLLPATTCEAELWPMILCKALMKLANVDTNGYERLALGEYTVMHSLTGWLPEIIPLYPTYIHKVWDFLKEIVTEFKPTEEVLPEFQGSKTDTQIKEDKVADVKNEVPAVTKPTEKLSKDKLETKETGKKKGDKDKTKDKTVHSTRPLSEVTNSNQPSTHEGLSVPQTPQMVVYASSLPLHVTEKKITLLGQMADSSEKMRMYGLSHTFSHPVLVTRIRSGSLVATPKPLPVPKWKLVRPRKDVAVTSEIKETILKKPEQFIEIASPFLNAQRSQTHLHIEGKGPPVLSTLSTLMENDKHHRQRNFLLRQSFNLSVEEEDEETDSDIESLRPHRYSRGSRVSDYDGQTVMDRDAFGTSSLSMQLVDKSEDSLLPEAKADIKETWIDFEDFCTCFQTLHIFHKPYTYPYTSQKSDLKSLDDRKSYYLFVDNPKPTEILISYSALIRWGDTGHMQTDRLNQPHGLLVAEHYSWKSLVTGPVALKTQTHATKATILSLCPGRNVLHITAHSPVGHHIHLCSTVPFIFGEEEIIMPYLEKESCRFIEQAKDIMKALGNMINNFSNEKEFHGAWKQLELILCPPSSQKSILNTEEYFKIFNSALWHLITKEIGNEATPDLIFAFRSLTVDVTLSRDLMEEPLSSDSRTEIPGSWDDTITSSLEEIGEAIVQESWESTELRRLNNARTPGTEENATVTETLHKLWMIIESNSEYNGIILLRNMFKYNSVACQIYSCYEDEKTKISFDDYTVAYAEQPANTWFVIFREVFHLAEDMLLVPKVYSSIPVCILHIINNDTMEEIPRVFHKVPPQIFKKNTKGYTFMAEASTGDYPVMAGKWRVRLIGSSHPLPRLSREIINSYFATKEVRDYYIPNKMHIVLRYGVKVDWDLIATVQVQTSKSDVFIKVQILENEEEIVSSTGKGHAVIPAFQFHFQQKERPLSAQSSRSEGINSPKKERNSPNINDSKTPSRPDSGQDIHILTNYIIPEHSLTTSQYQKYIIQVLELHNSWSVTGSEMAFIQELKEIEKNENKVFGEKLVQEDMSTGVNTEVQNTAAESHKSANISKSNKKGREKSSKDKDKQSHYRPGSQAYQHIDTTKPHWILHVVTELSEGDALELKKDTDRLDDIKAMKQAWESTEPGRSVKAMQARLQFINKYMESISPRPQTETDKVLIRDETEGEDIGPIAEEILKASLTALDRSSQHKKIIWEPLDLTPFMKKTMPKTVIKDEHLILQQQMQKAEEIRNFRQFREHVLEQRGEEQEARISLKRRLMQMYETLQISLDTARSSVLIAREAYRNKLIEDEMRSRESLAAQGTPSPTEMKTSSSLRKKKSGKKRKNN
ncbi:androglobin [Rhinatrema bivittatum]|uniref:androglobin n=1 Tax=Rhinatrema bivittatum TaxID=194408 RepID=UPI00112CA316|nr:androglobin [Rhinatrema bivittatum]